MLSIKARQVAGVTLIVGAAVVVLSAIHLTSLARVGLQESESRGEWLAHSLFHSARGIVADAADPYGALRADPGLRALLESSIAYSANVSYAAITDPAGVAIVHSFPAMEGQRLEMQGDLRALLRRSALAQLRAIYSDRTLEMRQPLLFGEEHFGSIRIGLSMLLIRNELQDALQHAAQTALLALLIAMVGSMLLAQWILRPIHVIKSGLSRLGQGDLGVTLDLPPGAEFRELGSSFDAISARLAAGRSTAGSDTNFQSVVEKLEDAVAIFSPAGEVLFANAALRAVLPDIEQGRRVDDCFPANHPYRRLVEMTLASRRSQGPVAAPIPAAHGGGQIGVGVERLMMTHVFENADRRFVGAILVARNLEYLSHLHSTLSYSRKLGALGRLMAGVAHEVKNPLNAMTIHLELLKQKLSNGAGARRRPALQPAAVGGADPAAAADGLEVQTAGQDDPLKHVTIIAEEIRRLDQVMMDFLKFTRPEELRLQVVQLPALIDDVVRVVAPEAEAVGVTVRVDCPRDLPDINADPGMLRQALLNLALNACQAMPDGGTLRFACRATSGRRVEMAIEDTGVGISPEHLERIFDLYFTTKEKGSGIGLSMVYRTIQLHDGDIEVQSMPGRGTIFRLLLPQT